MTTAPANASSVNTIQPSKIPRSASSTLHVQESQNNTGKKHLTNGTRNDETISPVTRKYRRPPSAASTSSTNSTSTAAAAAAAAAASSRSFMLPCSQPLPTSTLTSTSKRQEIFLILSPKDDKSDRRVVQIPKIPSPPIRVGRVVNPKAPAKFDNLLFDTKVLSRNHAECYSDHQGRVFIRDLGSSNGTYINGYRLSPDAVASEPFQLMVGQELALGIDIRDETNPENIAYHRVWFTVEHVGAMAPPPRDAPTPGSLGAVDLDPWIPKPSTRDIVDHLVQEINAAKQIAEEITSVQNVLDSLLQDGDAGTNVVERVQKELEEKTRRVLELESLLGVEREEKRALEERIRIMEDERALQLSSSEEGPVTPDIEVELDIEETNKREEPQVDKQDESPVTSLSIPDTEPSKDPSEPLPEKETTEPQSPSPSTAPSSPLPDRSISPISLPSTESSHPPSDSHFSLLSKIASLESQLASAQQEIQDYKAKLESVSPVMAAVVNGTGEFPFTFTVPANGSVKRSLRRRVPPSPRRRKAEEVFKETQDRKKDRDFIEGIVAAVGVVVLGWMGMWMINSFVERKAVK